MKKRLFFVLIVALFSLYRTEAKKVVGIIYYEHDTVSVIMKVPLIGLHSGVNFAKLQYEVVYFSKEKRMVLKPADAKEIRFSFDGEDVRMISCRNSLIRGDSDSRIFLQIEVDGPMRLFKYHSFSTTFYGPGSVGGSYPTVEYLLQRGDEDLKSPETTNRKFRKDMFEYFHDCPELANIIYNKELLKEDMISIAMYYNRKCI